MSGATEDILRHGLKSLQIELTDEQVKALLDYQLLIGKWTQVYNLTAVRDPAEMLTHHILDSLSIIRPLQRHLNQRTDGVTSANPSLLDVGSGAGLPGVVIAICCPSVRVVCVDTVGKKAAFITHASTALKLPNLRGLHARVEAVQEHFDIVCSRAFASLADFTTWSSAALAPTGVWLAMKGKAPEDEMAVLPPSVELFHVEQLRVPGLDAERCLLWLRHGQPGEAIT